MINNLKEKFPNINIKENVNMSKYSTFKVGGSTRYLIEISNIFELKETLKTLKKYDIPHTFLGNGSNTFFRDGMYEGAVLKFSEDSEFNDISIRCGIVTCGANSLLSAVSLEAMKKSLSGLEPLSGIPGTIGGVIYMSAGAYKAEIKDVVTSCHAVSPDGEIEKDFTLKDMDLSYRHSCFMDNGYIITSAKFKLKKGDIKEIEANMEDFKNRRNTTQPLKYPSCGSTFKRPEGHFAGKLIDDAGLKGLSVGGAEVSTLHAGFLINKGNATATDVINLIKEVQDRVYKESGVMLEPEVRII